MEKSCNNCRFCIYAHSMRGKEEPYCERHGKWIGDTLLCSEWEMVSVPKPLTNYDLLVRKTPEEFAAFHKSRGCPPLKSCPNIEELDGIPENGVCQKCWLDWLKQEASDGDTETIERAGNGQ